MEPAYASRNETETADRIAAGCDIVLLYSDGMNETATLTIRLPRVVVERLDRLALSTKRSKSVLAEEALAAYLAAQEWQTVAIAEAVAPAVTIVWYPLALDDLEDLRAYIEADDPGSAAVVAHRILDAVAALAEFPKRGRPGCVPGTRELVVPRTPYIVAYRLRDEVIEILRVLHGARRWPAP
jgi:toxin ParE1/3/4